MSNSRECNDIVYIINPVFCDKDKVLALFENVGWSDEVRDIDTSFKAILNSRNFVIAEKADTRAIIGLIRTIGDGLWSECIDMLCVASEYRNKGIATEMLGIIAELTKEIPFVYARYNALNATRRVYEKNGFVCEDKGGLLILNK